MSRGERTIAEGLQKGKCNSKSGASIDFYRAPAGILPVSRACGPSKRLLAFHSLFTTSSIAFRANPAGVQATECVLRAFSARAARTSIALRHVKVGGWNSVWALRRMARSASALLEVCVGGICFSEFNGKFSSSGYRSVDLFVCDL